MRLIVAKLHVDYTRRCK